MSMSALRTILAASVLCIAAKGVWAGGDDLFGDTEGHLPQFIGISRDIKSFKPIEGVRITASFKNQSLTTLTDAEGRFRIEGFIDGYDADSVQFKCEKTGYTQVNVIRRKISADANAPVEVECLNQPG